MPAELERDSMEVDGGRIEAWLRYDGVHGVTLLPENGPGASFVSTEDRAGFPPTYDGPALLAWGGLRWANSRPIVPGE